MEMEEVVGFLRCRIIGDVCGSVTVWGWELYVQGAKCERSCGRWLGVTEDMESVWEFCRRINNGAVSPLHAEDLARDLYRSIVDR